MFQELCATRDDIALLIPIVYTLYTFKYPLYYNHCNYDDDVNVIL